MASSRSQEGLRRELLADLGRLSVAFASLGAVAAERLAGSPGDNAWSAAQVLEHLCIATDSYLDRIEGLIGDPGARRVDDLDRQAWRPTLGGGLLVRVMESERKRRAPTIYRLGAVRPGVVAEFVTRLERLGRLLEAARDLDWRRVRFVSPVTRLVRMNLGDAFLVLVRHAERHLRQIERALIR